MDSSTRSISAPREPREWRWKSSCGRLPISYFPRATPILMRKIPRRQISPSRRAPVCRDGRGTRSIFPALISGSENCGPRLEAKFVNAREELNFGGPNFDIEDYSFVNFAAEYAFNAASHDLRPGRKPRRRAVCGGVWFSGVGKSGLRRNQVVVLTRLSPSPDPQQDGEELANLPLCEWRDEHHTNFVGPSPSARARHDRKRIAMSKR